MKLTFKEPTQITLVTHLDEENDPVEEIEVFYPGQSIEFDLIDHPQKLNPDTQQLEPDVSLWNVQFGNGSMCFGLDPSWFYPEGWEKIVYLNLPVNIANILMEYCDQNNLNYKVGNVTEYIRGIAEVVSLGLTEKVWAKCNPILEEVYPQQSKEETKNATQS